VPRYEFRGKRWTVFGQYDLSWMTPAKLAAYKAEWARPGRMRAHGQNWYRASPLQVASPPADHGFLFCPPAP